MCHSGIVERKMMCLRYDHKREGCQMSGRENRECREVKRKVKGKAKVVVARKERVGRKTGKMIHVLVDVTHRKFVSARGTRKRG